jgi:hypothetical protein
MKKALVLAMLCVFGLGAAAFAGPLSGTWDLSISIDPAATQANDLFIDLSTSLGLDYTIGGWVFGSSTTFDTIGWSKQSFTADGVLGAFTFSSTMTFLPRTVLTNVWTFVWDPPLSPKTPHDLYWDECWATDADKYNVKTYGVAFKDWKAVGSVSIAGVSFEAMFYLNSYAGDAMSNLFAFYYDAVALTLVQTSGDTAHVLLAPTSTLVAIGSGWRFLVSGSAGDLSIKSYTYFNLKEPFTTATCGSSLTKKGTFSIAAGNCNVSFYEQYFYLEGFSIGCAELAIGLDITCAVGFNWIAFEVSDIDLGFFNLTADFQVKFTTKTKVASFCFDFAVDTTCLDLGVSLDYSGSTINGFNIDTVGLEHTWNGITFSAVTYLNDIISTVAEDANQVLFLVPTTGMTNAAGDAIASVDNAGTGYYDAVCVNSEEYRVWESFTITSEGDSCCGGAFSFSVTTDFGTKYDLDAFAYDYQFDNTGVSPTVHADEIWTFLETDDVVPTIADVVDTDADLDGAVDIIDYSTIVGATELEQLLTGSIYGASGSDQLFEWVATKIDLEIGLSSAWSLLFGLDINVYGWQGLTFGFGFTF